MHPPAMSWSARIQFAKRVGILTPLNSLLFISTALHAVIGYAILFTPERLHKMLHQIEAEAGVGHIFALLTGSGCVALAILSLFTLLGPKPAPAANLLALASFHAM